MQATKIWKTVTRDTVDFLDELVDILSEHGVPYCVIGGQGVNAFVEPLISLDLDLVVAANHIEALEKALPARFQVEKFPHSWNISVAGSDLRVQIQTDPRYFAFVERASDREVLGLKLPVAQIEDVLQGKIWAATDPERRASKRRKDLLDIERLLEAYPELRSRVPSEILDHLSKL
jgi:hypothetical protein